MKSHSSIVSKCNYHNELLPACIPADSLTAEERTILSHFVCQSLDCYKKNLGNNRVAIPYAKSFARTQHGRKYFTSLSSLIAKGHLEILVLRKNKITGKDVTYSKKTRTCKSYMLSVQATEDLQLGKVTKIKVKTKKRYRAPKLAPTSSRLYYRGDDKDRETAQTIADRYREVVISREWESIFDGKHDEADTRLMQQVTSYIYAIELGKIRVSIPKSGRAYHPLINICKSLRGYAKHKDGDSLTLIDAKAFHPYLLASFITDETERTAYLDGLATDDIYSRFVDAKNDRDKIKKQFQVFLGSRKVLRGKARQISEWYRQNHPEIFHKRFDLTRAGTTMQMTLQQLESKIFVQSIYNTAHFWSLPMHDGLLVKSADTAKAMQHCLKKANNVLGYPISLDASTLTPNKNIPHDNDTKRAQPATGTGTIQRTDTGPLSIRTGPNGIQGSNLRWTLPNKSRLLRGGLTGTAISKSKTDRKEYQAAYYRANKAENKAVSEVKNEDKQARKALRSARNARYYDKHRMEILENASCYRSNIKDGAITEEAKKDFSKMMDNLEDICHGAPQDYCDTSGDACYYAQYDPVLEPEFTIRTTRKVQPPVSLAIIRD